MCFQIASIMIELLPVCFIFLFISPSFPLVTGHFKASFRHNYLIQFSSSVVSDCSDQLFRHVWPHGLQHTPGFPIGITNSWSLLKLTSIELVMPSNNLILCHPLLLPLLFPSFRVFSSESVLCTRWPNYWSFSFSISPANEYSGLISFRIDWFDLLAVQGTLKSLPQHHSSKASILRCSAFFIVQLSHPYMTTGKTIALTRWTFVSKITKVCFLLCYLG